MPTNRNRSTRAFTAYRGANYAGGQQTFTNDETGRVARRGPAVPAIMTCVSVSVWLVVNPADKDSGRGSVEARPRTPLIVLLKTINYVWRRRRYSTSTQVDEYAQESRLAIRKNVTVGD